MINSVFGETTFNMGWETSRKISLFGRDFSIIVSAAAYSETDRITPKQEEAYSHYLSGEGEILLEIESLLADYAGGAAEAEKRYRPCMLQIQQDGSYAMIFDDAEDAEDGVAVSIKPRYEVLPIDAYI